MNNSRQQRQLQRSAMIATQADVRNRFCCPQGGGEFVASRRQWLECYDCHATWCEEPATKRFCCPKDNLDTGQLIKPHLQCASFLLPRKNLHGRQLIRCKEEHLQSKTKNPRECKLNQQNGCITHISVQAAPRNIPVCMHMYYTIQWAAHRFFCKHLWPQTAEKKHFSWNAQKTCRWCKKVASQVRRYVW